MTWFETEQIYHYVNRLENALEEWALSRYQMQAVLAELNRLYRKLNNEMADNLQPPKKDILLGLSDRIRQCRGCIDERLKY